MQPILLGAVRLFLGQRALLTNSTTVGPGSHFLRIIAPPTCLAANQRGHFVARTATHAFALEASADRRLAIFCPRDQSLETLYHHFEVDLRLPRVHPPVELYTDAQLLPRFDPNHFSYGLIAPTTDVKLMAPSFCDQTRDATTIKVACPYSTYMVSLSRSVPLLSRLDVLNLERPFHPYDFGPYRVVLPLASFDLGISLLAEAAKAWNISVESPSASVLIESASALQRLQTTIVLEPTTDYAASEGDPVVIRVTSEDAETAYELQLVRFGDSSLFASTTLLSTPTGWPTPLAWLTLGASLLSVCRLPLPLVASSIQTLQLVGLLTSLPFVSDSLRRSTLVFHFLALRSIACPFPHSEFYLPLVLPLALLGTGLLSTACFFRKGRMLPAWLPSLTSTLFVLDLLHLPSLFAGVSAMWFAPPSIGAPGVVRAVGVCMLWPSILVMLLKMILLVDNGDAVGFSIILNRWNDLKIEGITPAQRFCGRIYRRVFPATLPFLTRFFSPGTTPPVTVCQPLLGDAPFNDRTLRLIAGLDDDRTTKHPTLIRLATGRAPVQRWRFASSLQLQLDFEEFSMRELDYQCLLWPRAVCGSHRMPLRGSTGGVSVLDLDVTLNHVIHLMQIGSQGPKIWVHEDLLYSPKHIIFGALLPPPMESPHPRSRTFGGLLSDIHRLVLGLAALLLACIHGLISQQQSALRATKQQLFTAHFRQDMMAACPRFTWHVLIVLWVLLTTAFVATAAVTTRQALTTGARRARRLHSDAPSRGCTVLEGGKSDMDMGRALAYAPPESARQIYPHLYGKTPRGWISDRLRRPSTGKVNTLTAIHEAKRAAGGDLKLGGSLGSPQWTLVCDVLLHSDARHAVFLSLFLLMMTLELLPVTAGTYYPVSSELLALIPFTNLLVPVGVMLLTTPVPWSRLYDRLIEVLVPLRTVRNVAWLGDHPHGNTAATTSSHVTRPRKVVVGFEGLGLEMTGECVAPPDRGIVLDTASGALKLANETEDDELLFMASRDSMFQEADNVARKKLIVLGTGLSDALRFSCSRACRLPRDHIWTSIQLRARHVFRGASLRRRLSSHVSVQLPSASYFTGRPTRVCVTLEVVHGQLLHIQSCLPGRLVHGAAESRLSLAPLDALVPAPGAFIMHDCPRIGSSRFSVQYHPASHSLCVANPSVKKGQVYRLAAITLKPDAHTRFGTELEKFSSHCHVTGIVRLDITHTAAPDDYRPIRVLDVEGNESWVSPEQFHYCSRLGFNKNELLIHHRWFVQGQLYRFEWYPYGFVVGEDMPTSMEEYAELFLQSQGQAISDGFVTIQLKLARPQTFLSYVMGDNTIRKREEAQTKLRWAGFTTSLDDAYSHAASLWPEPLTTMDFPPPLPLSQIDAVTIQEVASRGCSVIRPDDCDTHLLLPTQPARASLRTTLRDRSAGSSPSQVVGDLLLPQPLDSFKLGVPVTLIHMVRPPGAYMEGVKQEPLIRVEPNFTSCLGFLQGRAEFLLAHLLLLTSVFSRVDPDLDAIWQAAVAVLGVADCQRYWRQRGHRPLETGLPGVSAMDESEGTSLLGSKGCLGSTTAQDTVPLCRRATRLLLKCLRSLRREFDQVAVWHDAYVAQGALAEAQREREIAEHHFAFVSVNTPVGDALRCEAHETLRTSLQRLQKARYTVTERLRDLGWNGEFSYPMVVPGCRLVRTPSLSEQLLLWEDQLDYWFRDELALPESLPRVPSKQADVRCSRLNPAVKLVSDALLNMWTGGGDFVRIYTDLIHLVTTSADLKRICKPPPREQTVTCPLCCPAWLPAPLPLVFAYVRVWTAHPSDAGRPPSLLSGAAMSELAPCFLRLLPDRIEIRIPSDPRRRTPLPREWQVLDAGERESLLLLSPLVCSRRRVVGWEVPLQAFQRVRLDKDRVSVSEDPVDIHMPYRLRFQRSLMTMVGDGFFRRLDDFHLDSRVMLIDQQTESPTTFHLLHGRKLHVSDPLVSDPRVGVDPEELMLAQSDLAEQLKYLKEPETVNGFPLEFRLAESAAELWRAAIASANLCQRPAVTFAKNFQGNVKAMANAERKERYEHIETRKLALFEMTTEDEERAMAIRRERQEKKLWEQRQALLLNEDLPMSPAPRSSVRSTAQNTFRVAACKADSDRLSDVITAQAEDSSLSLRSASAPWEAAPELPSRRGTVWDGSVSGLGCILSRDGNKLFEGFFGAQGREGSAVLLFPGKGSVSCSFHNDDLVGKVGVEQHESYDKLKLWNQPIYSIKASLITRSTPSRFTQKLQATYADHPDSEYTPPGTDHKPWELYLPIDDLSAFMGNVDSFQDVFHRVHHAYIACRSGSTFTGYLLWGLPEGEGLWTVPVTDFVDSTASPEFPDATFSETQLSEISCYWRKGIPDGKGTMRTMRQYTGLEKNLPDIKAVVNYTYEGSFVKGQRDGKSAVVRCEADIGKEKRVLFVFNGWFEDDHAHRSKCMVKCEKPQGLPDRFRGLTWLPMSQLEFFRGEFCEGQIQGRCNVRLLTKVNQKLRKSFVVDGDWLNSMPHGTIRIHEGGISDSDEHVAFRGTFENGVPHGPCHLLTFDLVDHQSKGDNTAQLSFHGTLNQGSREGYGVIREETIHVRGPDAVQAQLPRRTHQVLFEGLFFDDLPDVRGVIHGTYLSRSGELMEYVYEGEIRKGQRHGLGQITGRSHHTAWSLEGRWEDDFLRGPAGMTLHRAKGKHKTLRAFVEESGAVRLPARTKISQQWSLLQRDAEKALRTGTDPRLACPLLPRHLRASGKYWLFGFGAFMTKIDLSSLLPHLATTAMSHDLPWSNFEPPTDIPP